ncbi:MAG TPA: hypothetical protein VLD18_02865, partial [Verrucomicrobiae bacterium]|nr:hypothetical protein [Verrucomicrobiae bacterium]
LHPVSDTTHAFAVGETVSGVIAVPGQRGFHHFTMANPALLFFDNLSNAGFPWTLTGPQGVVVNGRALWNSDGVDGNSRMELPAGDYVIEIDPGQAGTGGYSFRLVDASSAVPFAVGSPVNGSLTPGNTTAFYRFHAAAGQRFYYDGLSRSGFSSAPYLRIDSPFGVTVLSSVQVQTDSGPFLVSETGDYLLAVEGRYLDESDGGQFSFQLLPVVDETNTFTIGETVQGAIATPGQRQFHRFTLTNPARLIFDGLGNSGIPWTLSGPAGVIVNGRPLWSSDSLDGDPLLELEAGDYVISLDLTGAGTGAYSFRLLDASTAMPFVPGTLVNGSLAPGNSTALYRFTAAAGDRFYFDGRPLSGFSSDPYTRV